MRGLGVVYGYDSTGEGGGANKLIQIGRFKLRVGPDPDGYIKL
jgi:hypothetical protein